MNKRLMDTKLFLLDLDGTIYLSDKLFDGVIHTIENLIANGLKICFLTNNSSKTKQEYVDKLTKMGIDMANCDLITSTLVSADYINSHFKGARVYCLLREEVKEELRALNVNVVEECPDIVLVGYDTSLNYQKIAKACAFIKSGAKYFITHGDNVCPSKYGDLPDVGSFIALIKVVSEESPSINCGKPGVIMGDFIKKRFDINSELIAMVGDRLYTDIRFGNANGFKSVLVLSGETDEEMLNISVDNPFLVLKGIKNIILD